MRAALLAPALGKKAGVLFLRERNTSQDPRQARLPVQPGGWRWRRARPAISLTPPGMGGGTAMGAVPGRCPFGVRLGTAALFLDAGRRRGPCSSPPLAHQRTQGPRHKRRPPQSPQSHLPSATVTFTPVAAPRRPHTTEGHSLATMQPRLQSSQARTAGRRCSWRWMLDGPSPTAWRAGRNRRRRCPLLPTQPQGHPNYTSHLVRQGHSGGLLCPATPILGGPSTRAVRRCAPRRHSARREESVRLLHIKGDTLAPQHSLNALSLHPPSQP